ncbi:MAG: glycerol-3-phosphate 1-O-acyltransferase PlsY [Gemmatimonadota bacterium]|nr:glycerol-3-phosphate 1-O-acyltransferase PlsY [Gemmatimonadota bacterium]
MNTALAVALSYIVGSIPAAYLAGKSRGIDLRRYGSGNLGATNVVRALGWKVGLAVFAFDVAKGALSVLLLPRWADGPLSREVVAILCGVAAILGHFRPVFLKFGKGGKGVATATGVFLALAPLPTLAGLAVFGLVLLASGYVSLGSLTAAVILPSLLLLTEGVRSSVFQVSVVLAIFVFWTHRANIRRLRRGEEYRFGRKAEG